MAEAFLVGGVRTAVGKYGGALSAVRPDDLAAHVLRAVVDRSGIPADAIDEVILGNANQAGEDNRNVARMAALLAGLPASTPGVTVNRLCASGLTAVHLAAQMIKTGEADIVIAGGVESMSRAPWVMAKPTRAFARPGEIADTSIGWRFTNPRLAADPKNIYSMPETAEEVAHVYGITREDADRFALRSHENATAAIASGAFAQEIIPVEIAGGLIDTDEGPRADTSMDALGALRSVVAPGGVVTAGNSSSLNDGASAVVVASEDAVARWGLAPRARVVAGASAGVAPAVMGIGPVPATQKALDRAGWSIGNLGAVELNEAFATQALAVSRQLGVDLDIVNRDGGAIALGHPLGSSGARIVVTLLGRMEREGVKRSLATMCVGVGQGTAVLLEAV
ncbi:acetyl-CoA C-acyltransferase [Microbacterium sp. ARD31]|uniref:thiolase family protein n=1 Tax=Microbacterium sp. ARD31 TaxID=2962576 RepID=UPI002880CC8F|nr:acetyl-CoA C-acyltransferase [Microbacterium sp. ARD31]MDT0186066.1 acetyl-CoA C-acyltransferase [Microbacterium sp. ARD31]